MQATPTRFTGRHGLEAVEAAVSACGDALGIAKEQVFMASTGVIGEPLPAGRITVKLAELRDGLSASRIEDAANAIMTTDTFPKGAAATADLDGATVTISGFAKGSGMIAPDMATMLVFIFTDASISQPVLQATVAGLTDKTFNAITVDSDTSTSDTLLVGATGKAAMAPITSQDDPRFPAFRDALRDVMQDLAIQVVKDGEGASKFAAITVTGAESDGAAQGASVWLSPTLRW